MAHEIYRNKVGIPVPSVTTIIGAFANKEFLIAWARNLMRDYGIDYIDEQDKAGIIGSLAHEMVENDLLNKQQRLYETEDKDNLDSAKLAYSGYLKWKKTHKIDRVLGVEAALVSEQYQYAGRIDNISVIRSMRTILDLKTSKTVNKDYLVQIAAYGQLWNENYPDQPIEQYEILRIDKLNGGYDYYSWDNLDNEFKIFRLYRVAYRLIYETEIDLSKNLISSER